MINTATDWVMININGREVKIVTELNHKAIIDKEINILEENVAPMIKILKRAGIEHRVRKYVTRTECSGITIDENDILIERNKNINKRVEYKLIANCTGESLHRIIVAIREIREEGGKIE